MLHQEIRLACECVKALAPAGLYSPSVGGIPFGKERGREREEEWIDSFIFPVDLAYISPPLEADTKTDSL